MWVVYADGFAGVNIRKAPSLSAGIHGHVSKGDIVYGYHKGDWLKLDGEPGYIRILSNVGPGIMVKKVENAT